MEMAAKRKIASQRKEAPIGIRFTDEQREELEAEAAAEFMDLSSYIRKLVLTHPDRKKKK